MKEPLVLCLTNTVAANFTANCLLAIGAKPAMIEEPSEAAELAAVADATLVNLGTVTPVQAEVMRAAIAVCNVQRKPWVLDPVACQALSYRQGLMKEFLTLKPTVIRANAAEIAVILGSVPRISEAVGMKSEKVRVKSEEVKAPCLSLNFARIAYLSTGEVDRIGELRINSEDFEENKDESGINIKIGAINENGDRDFIEVMGGVPMLQSVTATGCAQGAIVAALLGWGQTPRNACLVGSRLMKQAGERAFERAKTPGSFQIALIDALYELTRENKWLGE